MEDDSDGTLRATIAPRVPTPDTPGKRAMVDLANLSKSHPARLGEALLLEETIGAGGMGIIHVATQTAVGRKVAVKMLRPEQRTPAQAMHLLREAWLTGRLEHPSVVPVYDVSLDEGGQPVVVLRRIEGTEWAALLFDPVIVRKRFKAHDILEWHLRILMQVCNAIHFAHQRGILHRDLKPENVMVGDLGEVYVLDWGIAVSSSDDETGRLPLLKDAREVAGTPFYMAPEMWAADPTRLSARTDVYLLGAILFEILTGQPPHTGKSVAEVSALASEPIAIPENLPPGLRTICARALAIDPNARHESALALRRDLEEYLEGRGAELLMGEAERAMSSLYAELRRPEPRRDVVYNLFGACRFGFEQALARTPEVERAQRGLERAVATMVEHELATDDPKAAAALLASLGTPNPQLAERVAAAERDHAARAQQRKQFEAIGREHDFRVGERTRAFLGLVLGVLWTVVPLLSWRVEALRFHSYLRLYFGSAIVLVIVIGLGVWARESMSKTAFNRGLIGSAVFVPFAQLLLVTGDQWLGLPISTTYTQLLIIWGVMVAIVGLTVERRLLGASAMYLTAWLICARHPGLTLPLISLSNFTLLLIMVYIWRPRR